MPRLIYAVLHERNAELGNQCLNLEKAAEWSRDLLGRFSTASGDNLMEAVVAGRAAVCQPQIDALKARITVIGDALDVLSGVTFQIDHEPRPSASRYWMPTLHPKGPCFIKPPVEF